MTRIVAIGIDPGKKGGFCVMPVDGGSLFAGVLPWAEDDLDGRAVLDVIQTHGVTHAAIEKAQAMPGQGVTSMFSYGYGAGKLAGVLEAASVSYRLVRPTEWKKVVLAGTARDKGAAIDHVRHAYPHVDLTPGRLRTPHDGMADAVCIAEWLVGRLVGA